MLARLKLGGRSLAFCGADAVDHRTRAAKHNLILLMSSFHRSWIACRNFELEGLELTRRELITPLLNLAALLTSKEVELRAEAHVQGSLGHGPIDYTALIEKVQVLLAEAKRHELGKHRGQVRRNGLISNMQRLSFHE